MASVPKRLKQKHLQAAAMRARGMAWSDIAESLGVNESTARAWGMAEPFQELVERLRREVIEAIEGVLVGAAVDAARELVRLVTEAESEHVQLGAAREVLERAGAGRPSRADEAGVVLRIHLDG